MKRIAIALMAVALGLSACSKKSGGGGGGDGGSDGSDTDTNTDPETTTTTTTHNLIMFDGNNKLHSLNVATGAVTKISDNALIDASKTRADGHNGTDLGVAVNGKFYFAAAWNGKGRELWVYDPTKDIDATGFTNPSLVKDINAGATSSVIEAFVGVGNYVLFLARTTAEGNELWQFDTTAAVSATNPKLTYDLMPGSSSPNSGNFFAMGNKLYFSGFKVTNQAKLWRYDPAAAGSATNPKQISDINPGARDSFQQGFAAAGDKLYFSAKKDGNERSLYYIDTTEASPTVNKVSVNISNDGNDDDVRGIAGDGSRYVALHAETENNGRELGVFDTTQAAATTTNPKMHDLRSGSDESRVNEITHLTGSKFAFIAQKTATVDQNLFILDASEAFSATNPKEINLTSDNTYVDEPEIRYVDGKIIVAGGTDNSSELGNFIAIYDMNATSNPLSIASKKTIANNISKLVPLSYTTTTTTTSKD